LCYLANTLGLLGGVEGLHTVVEWKPGVIVQPSSFTLVPQYGGFMAATLSRLVWRLPVDHGVVGGNQVGN
jgi:hypothetical protein